MDPLSYVFSLLPAQAAVPVLAAIGLCAVLDAVLPQPRAGSRWVLPRRIVTLVGANWLNARNLVSPGTAVPAPVTQDEAGQAVSGR